MMPVFQAERHRVLSEVTQGHTELERRQEQGVGGGTVLNAPAESLTHLSKHRLRRKGRVPGRLGHPRDTDP